MFIVCVCACVYEFVLFFVCKRYLPAVLKQNESVLKFKTLALPEVAVDIQKNIIARAAIGTHFFSLSTSFLQVRVHLVTHCPGCVEGCLKVCTVNSRKSIALFFSSPRGFNQSGDDDMELKNFQYFLAFELVVVRQQHITLREPHESGEKK